jgi:hypothetical protein
VAKIRKSGRVVYACSLENCRTETFREFESHLFRHNLGSVQQTKTLKCYDSLSGQNDPVIYGRRLASQGKTVEDIVAFHIYIFGLLAQLGERLPCKQEVRSSILLGSTKYGLLVKRLIRLPVTQKNTGSIPVQVAKLVYVKDSEFKMSANQF